MQRLRLAARRLALLALTLWGLATVVFIMMKVVPGNEAQVAAGPGASQEQIVKLAERMGLDQPLPFQYAAFLRRMLGGDLGTSIQSGRPVLQDLLELLPSTLELVFYAAVLGTLMAFPLAMISSTARGQFSDFAARVCVLAVGSMPAFWLALMLQYLCGSVWEITPISGQSSYGMAPPVLTGVVTFDALLSGNPAMIGDAFAHMALPAFVFAVPFAGQCYRLLRASLLHVLTSDMIAPLRAKGAHPARIMLSHALPNAVAPTISLMGTLLGVMVASAILVEMVFGRPGVGSYLANAVEFKDTYAVLGTVMFIGIAVCLLNLAADLLIALIDPRLRRLDTARAS